MYDSGQFALVTVTEDYQAAQKALNHARLLGYRTYIEHAGLKKADGTIVGAYAAYVAIEYANHQLHSTHKED